MKEQSTAFDYFGFNFLVVPIENSVSAFSSWKTYNAGEINEENRQALFNSAEISVSKTESFVVPVYKSHAYLPFNLKSNNFFITLKKVVDILYIPIYILYTLKLYSNIIIKVVTLNFRTFVKKVVILNFKQKR